MNKIINILENIDTFQLGLENPRFQLISHLVKEPWECFLMRERHKNQIKDLIKDILKEKLFDNIFMVKKENEKLIMLDGNRRIFALKFLFSEEFKNKIKLKDWNFYQELKKLVEENPNNLYEIKNSLIKSVITIYHDDAEIKKALRRKHAENIQKDGKYQTKWGTWETKLNQNEMTAVYFHDLLKKIELEVFVETIEKRPIITHTFARTILGNIVFRNWLKITYKNKRYKSDDEKITLKKIKYVLHYRLTNPKKGIKDIFHTKNVRENIKEIERKYLENQENKIFDYLLDKKEKLINGNFTDSIINDQKIEPKTKKSKKVIYLKEIYSLIKNENTKLCELIKTIHDLNENQIKKYRYLVYISLRTVIELFTRWYLNEIIGIYIHYENQMKISVQINKIVDHIRNNFDLKKIDFDAIKNFHSGNIKHLMNLNQVMHGKEEVYISDLLSMLRSVDRFGCVILNIIKNKNNYKLTFNKQNNYQKNI